MPGGRENGRYASSFGADDSLCTTGHTHRVCGGERDTFVLVVARIVNLISDFNNYDDDDNFWTTGKSHVIVRLNSVITFVSGHPDARKNCIWQAKGVDLDPS